MTTNRVVSLRPRNGEELSPTQLVLIAALRAAQHYELPDQERIEGLVYGDNFQTVDLARHYAAIAKQELAYRMARRRIVDLDLTVEFGRGVLGATTMGWKIRQAAQGTRAIAPSMEAWELLVMVIVVAYERARDKATTFELGTWIDDLAIEISGH